MPGKHKKDAQQKQADDQASLLEEQMNRAFWLVTVAYHVLVVPLAGLAYKLVAAYGHVVPAGDLVSPQEYDNLTLGYTLVLVIVITVIKGVLNSLLVVPTSWVREWVLSDPGKAKDEDQKKGLITSLLFAPISWIGGWILPGSGKERDAGETRDGGREKGRGKEREQSEEKAQVYG